MSALATIARLVGQNATKILTVAAAVGVVTTAVATAKAVNDSKETLQEYKDEDISLTKKEVVRLTWYHYIPPAIFAGLTIYSIYKLNLVHTKSKDALGAAYLLMSKDFKSYQDEVVKMVGESKSKKIFDNQAQTALLEAPESPNDEPVLVSRYGGTTLCFDCVSGRQFISDIELLRRAENEANAILLEESWVSLNTVYDLIGIDNISIGEDIGWHYEDDRFIDFMFSSALTPNGKPCMTINLKPKAKEQYKGYY